MTGKYTWTENQTDELWCNDRFDTIEECLADALKSGKQIGDKIAIGICEDSGCDKGCYGIELSQEKLNKVLDRWHAAMSRLHNFYRITPLADMYELHELRDSAE